MKMEGDLLEKKPDAYSELRQTSNMENFSKIIKEFQLLTNFTKSSILDVMVGSEYAFESYFFYVC